MELNKRSRENLKGVHPDLIKVIEEAAKDTPIPFTITEGVRTAERQIQLFAQGRRNKPGEKKVTNIDGVSKKSNHQVKADGYGYAVDLYAEPINVNDTKKIKIIAEHIKATSERLGIPIVWGGNWKMRDYPHFELKN